MSHMRDIEAALRGDVGYIEKEIPFWEFIDIEYDAEDCEFIFTAHYNLRDYDIPLQVFWD